MNFTKKNTDTIAIISLVVNIFLAVIFWIVPFEKLQNFIPKSVIQKINENFYLFIFIFLFLIILSLLLLLLSKKKKIKDEKQEISITDEERKTLIKSLKSRYNERFNQKLDNWFRHQILQDYFYNIKKQK